jgi:ABC-type multidrug transport system fused ATPase/permease subunit
MAGFSHKLTKDPLSSGRVDNGVNDLTLLKPYLKRHWKKGVVGTIAIIFTALLAFPQPLITRFLVDKVILGKHLEWLLWTVLALAAIKAISAVSGMVEQYAFSRFQLAITLDMQHTILDHTLQLPKTFFDDKEIGYLMSRVVSDVQGLSWFFSQTVVYIFTNLLRFIGGIVFLFFLEWRLAIATIIVLPLLVFSVNEFSKRMRILSHNSMEQNANIYTRFQETLSSVPLIKAFVSENQESERVIDSVKTAQTISMEQTVVSSVANTVINLVPDISKAVVLLVGAYLVIKGNWTIGSLLAFQSYLGYVYGPALSLAGINLQLQNALASLDRVSALLEVTPESAPGIGKKVDHLKGAVQFEHVCFSYNKEETILEDISFNVKPGEHIAIVGPSGVGKTTLISLLLRFYLPLSGQIIFDNIDASEYSLDSLRQRIGYVSQSTLLMAGTIGENLRYGNQNASSEEIEKAVRTAEIYDFIMGLPQKYDSIVGEKGVNFSEGQKQRLSIARALIKDPDILIMDEPTAALDSLTESLIFETLPTKIRGKTLFMIAHRLSTIKNSDQILVLNDKHQSGFGTQAELMENNLYYRSLIENNTL